MTFLSKNYRTEDFPNGMSLDDKIKVFEDRVLNWQLNIAKECAEKVPHSGYAILNIVCSYFETIEQFRSGENSETKSNTFFKKGLEEVFPEIKSWSVNIRDHFIGMMYKNMRCGLYHSGMTSAGILITGMEHLIVIEGSGNVIIDPLKLTDRLIAHFRGYITELKNPASTGLRTNFEKRFDNK